MLTILVVVLDLGFLLDGSGGGPGVELGLLLGGLLVLLRLRLDVFGAIIVLAGSSRGDQGALAFALAVRGRSGSSSSVVTVDDKDLAVLDVETEWLDSGTEVAKTVVV